MSQEPSQSAGQDPDAQRVMVVGPDGMTVAEPGERHVSELIEQPAKVMRIGSMIRQLLEEVKAAPVDEAGRTRLASILHTSVAELKDGLAPELDAELDRLVEPFSGPTPSESELRIAQAQLVGWLEGLFSGIQTAIYAQQMAARAQLEQMRRALPPGMPGHEHPGQDGTHDGSPGGSQDLTENGSDAGQRGGMYL